MVCRLKTRCSILAVTNPKGHYDPQEVCGQGTDVLSWFEVALGLVDQNSEECMGLVFKSSMFFYGLVQH